MNTQKKTLRCITLFLCLAVLLNGCRQWNSLADGLGQGADAIEQLFSDSDGTQAPEKGQRQTNPNDTSGEANALPKTEDVPADPWENTYYDPLLYPYYGQLNADAQAVYRQICYYTEEGLSSFTPCRTLQEADIEPIMTAVYYDQPSLFWLDGDYEYRHRDGQIVEVILHFNDLAESLEANRRRFEEAAEQILTEARSLSDPADRERLAHDLLLERVVYEENAPYNQNAYSALVRGAAVCAGYARAFQYLLLRMNIPCYYCVGTAVSYQNTPEGAVEDHAWNIIALDGEYYNVDPTWDDTLLAARGLISYGYYNETDERFLTDHTRDPKSAELPACNGQRHTYEALYGQPAELGILPALGLTDEDVIYDLDTYYSRCLQTLIETGPGQSALTVVLWGNELMDTVQASVNSGAYEDGFLRSAIEALRLNGYHFSIHISLQEMGGGCYLLEQTMTLE